MKYIVDSSAWIEYLEGSEKGEKISNILNQNNEIFILSLNIAEVVSRIKRKKSNFNLAYETLITKAKLLNLTPKIAKEAGILHGEIKPKVKSFSLADALIIKSAEAISAKIITTDYHFKSFKEVVLI